MGNKNRETNIELLRILTICGVVVLHYNGNVAFSHVAKKSVNFYILYFVLISGYFSCTSTKRKAVKPLELVVQVMIIGFIKYVATCVMGGYPLSLVHIVASMIPNNYFVFCILQYI